MKVLFSGVSGYCMGVRRAVDLTFGAIEKNKKVWTYGELIHNGTVLERLTGLGVKIISGTDRISDLHGETVVLCAHGVPPETEAALKAAGAEIIDASCPMVKKSQLKAAELSENNYSVFLAGEKNHSEIIGIKGYNNDAIIVSNAQEASIKARELYNKAPYAKTAALAQTTISETEYNDISGEIKKIFPALKIINTICGATAARQKALKELCARSDALIIAGARSSSNTRRLLAIARNENIPAWLVENESELPAEIFSYKTIGIAAGASTPDEITAGISLKLLGQGTANSA
jgi:4-hydroxy-3-methylbut-2-enyl diphosphate reductase